MESTLSVYPLYKAAPAIIIYGYAGILILSFALLFQCIPGRKGFGTASGFMQNDSIQQ